MLRRLDVEDCKKDNEIFDALYGEDKKSMESIRVDRMRDVGILANVSPEMLERKRLVYLRNAGINVVIKSLRDLADADIMSVIETLDEATKNEAFLRIRKQKQGVAGAIENLRAIMQGMIVAENNLRSKLTEAEKLIQERKDREYKPVRRVANGDATKTPKKPSGPRKGSIEERTGINADALLDDILGAIEKDSK